MFRIVRLSKLKEQQKALDEMRQTLKKAVTIINAQKQGLDNSAITRKSLTTYVESHNEEFKEQYKLIGELYKERRTYHDCYEGIMAIVKQASHVPSSTPNYRARLQTALAMIGDQVQDTFNKVAGMEVPGELPDMESELVPAEEVITRGEASPVDPIETGDDPA